MAVKRKRLGDVETVIVSNLLREHAEKAEGEGADKLRRTLEERAAEFEGVEVDFVFGGQDLLKKWSKEADRLRLLNAKELAKIRKGTSKDLVPELYEDYDPPGALERMQGYTRLVLTDSVRHVRGVEDHPEDEDPEEHAALLVELGLGLVLSDKATEIQRLLKTQSFS